MSYVLQSGVPQAPIITSHQETVQSPSLEYTLMWSTLTLFPILEYLLMFKEYRVDDQAESDNWEAEF